MPRALPENASRVYTRLAVSGIVPIPPARLACWRGAGAAPGSGGASRVYTRGGVPGRAAPEGREDAGKPTPRVHAARDFRHGPAATRRFPSWREAGAPAPPESSSRVYAWDAVSGMGTAAAASRQGCGAEGPGPDGAARPAPRRPAAPPPRALRGGRAATRFSSWRRRPDASGFSRRPPSRSQPDPCFYAGGRGGRSPPGIDGRRQAPDVSAHVGRLPPPGRERGALMAGDPRCERSLRGLAATAQGLAGAQLGLCPARPAVPAEGARRGHSLRESAAVARMLIAGPATGPGSRSPATANRRRDA